MTGDAYETKTVRFHLEERGQYLYITITRFTGTETPLEDIGYGGEYYIYQRMSVTKQHHAGSTDLYHFASELALPLIDLYPFDLLYPRLSIRSRGRRSAVRFTASLRRSSSSWTATRTRRIYTGGAAARSGCGFTSGTRRSSARRRPRAGTGTVSIRRTSKSSYHSPGSPLTHAGPSKSRRPGSNHDP